MPTADALVIVPALNEAATVGRVVSAIRRSGFDVVVVDDGSTDTTAVEAQLAGAGVLRLPVNLGVGAALRCGFRYAVESGYSAAIQCDADGQHIPSYFDSLLRAAEEQDAHLVIGSRFSEVSSFPFPGRARRTAMRYLAFVTSRSAGTRLTDVTSGFRLVRGELLEHFARNFPPYYLGDTFEATYVAVRAGYRVVEVPVEMRERAHGNSSASTLSSVLLIAKVVATTSLGLHFTLPPFTGRGEAPRSG